MMPNEVQGMTCDRLLVPVQNYYYKSRRGSQRWAGARPAPHLTSQDSAGGGLLDCAGGGASGLVAGGGDARPVAAGAVLALGDLPVHGGDVAAAPRPRGLAARAALHLVAHRRARSVALSGGDGRWMDGWMDG